MAGQTGRTPDRRARLAAKPLQRELVYGPNRPTNIMYPLHPEGGWPGGMVWPFTPNITFQQNVQYEEYDLSHVNQSPQAYKKTDTLALEVIGDFTVQNSWEARYVFACIHFLTTLTKIQYGINSDNPGAPPPVLEFSAYGNMMFDRLPVVVRSFSVPLTNDVDYVKVDLDEIESLNPLPDFVLDVRGSFYEAWVPSKLSMSVSLLYNPSPQRHVNVFDWQSFRNGTLLKDRGGFR